MAKSVFSQTRLQGIADFPKESLIPDQAAWTRSIDWRTNPRQWTLLPKTTKESGTTIQGLPKWATINNNGLTFIYDETGLLYSRNSAGTYSTLFHALDGHGNGLEYFGGDDFVYYTTDTTVSRYGPFNPDLQTYGYAVPDFNFLQRRTTNQFSTIYFAVLNPSDSAYLEGDNFASTRLTGDLTIKFELSHIQAVADGDTMTILSKWDENGQRSYVVDLLGIAGANIRLRLGISDDGTSTEYYTCDIAESTTATDQVYAITWDASASTAKFYRFNSLLATTTGAKTSIFNSTAPFLIGAKRDSSSVPYKFLNGEIKEVSIYNAIVGGAQAATVSPLDSTVWLSCKGYWPLDLNGGDETTNANDLTLHTVEFVAYFSSYPTDVERADIDLSGGGVANTYTVPTTISEAAANTLPITPTKAPMQGILFNIDTAGSGSLTMTVHDNNNRVVAAETLPAGFFANEVFVEFVIAPDAFTPVIGNSYHVHLTSTVADTTIKTTTAADFSTAKYQTYVSILVTNSLYHPIKTMLNFLAFGNGRYVATWDGAVYNPNRITLPAEYNIRCFAYWREYLAIGVWRGSNIYDVDQGRIYFWDGISTTFNFFIDVPEGSINALFGSKGELYVWAGYQGEMLKYVGGDSATKIKRLPKMTKDKYVEILPGAVNMYRTLIHFGIDGATDSTAIEKGVYSWGSYSAQYPEALSYDYPISTGNRTATNIKIGMVFAVDRKLLIGWQDNATHGVDVVDPSAAPFATGTVEWQIRDEDVIWRDQMGLVLRGDFLPLLSGESIDVKYQLDRDGVWHGLASAQATVGAKTANLNINAGRNREYQIAIDLMTSGSTSPTAVGLSLLQDRLEEEEQFPGGGPNI